MQETFQVRSTLPPGVVVVLQAVVPLQLVVVPFTKTVMLLRQG